MKIHALFPQSLFSVLALIIAQSVHGQTHIIVPGLYNTGVDSFGVVKPLQSSEQHYQLSGPSSLPYVVTPVNYPPLGWAWLAAPAGSAWIGPNSTTNPASPDPEGIYHYTMQFDLSAFDASQVRITGSWMTDNSGQLFLNGVSTGFTTDPQSYIHLSSFNLETGFVSGLNTLEFRVLNEFVGPNPTGLCVSGLAATLVPEPTAIALLVMGFAGLTSFRRMRS